MGRLLRIVAALAFAIGLVLCAGVPAGSTPAPPDRRAA